MLYSWMDAAHDHSLMYSDYKAYIHLRTSADSFVIPVEVLAHEGSVDLVRVDGDFDFGIITSPQVINN